MFNDLFARMDTDRDRALLAILVSAGLRAAELLGVTRSRVDVGDQLVGVVRKGSRAVQWVPASPDAFVWLRCYQQQMRGLVPAGPNDAVAGVRIAPGHAFLTRQNTPFHQPRRPCADHESDVVVRSREQRFVGGRAEIAPRDRGCFRRSASGNGEAPDGIRGVTVKRDR